jgi:hypothetical protein
MIFVEEIQKATADLEGYHEALADDLFAKFGGSQRLTAHHHGTDIETTRP